MALNACFCTSFALFAQAQTAKVIIDADTAATAVAGLDVDDNLAVAYLTSSIGVEVLGVTATYGNAPLFLTCPDARRTVELLFPPESRPPVKCGLGFRFSSPFSSPPSEAAMFLAEQARAHPGEVIWIGIGALDNIAQALFHFPDVAPLLKRIVMMGGDLRGWPELNFGISPSAASFVLRHSGVRKTLLTVQTCKLCVFESRHVELLRSQQCSGSYAHRFIDLLERHRVRFSWLNALLFGPGPKESLGFHPWDIVAVAAVTDPQLFPVEEDAHGHDCVHLDVGLFSGLRVRRVASSCSEDGAVFVPATMNVESFIAKMMDKLCQAGKGVNGGGSEESTKSDL